jgi:hypothetical protein
MPTSPINTQAAEPPNQATLGAVIAASTTDLPVVLLPSEAVTAVVLSSQHGTAELLLSTGTTRRETLGRAALRVTDPAREAPLLRQAATGYADQIHRNRILLDSRRREHRDRLREIRDYAVARHREGDLGRAGLDTFLEQFDLDVYEPQIRVWFTITGSYRVRGDTEETAARDGDGYLGLDLSRLDGVVEDTADFTVHVERTEEVDD